MLEMMSKHTIGIVLSLIVNILYCVYLIYGFWTPSNPADLTIVHSTLITHESHPKRYETNYTEVRWNHFRNLSNLGWCHYPDYQSTFQFNTQKYQETHRLLCESIYPSNFTISVSNTGYLTTHNCFNDTFIYSTTHQFSDNQTAIVGVQLQWPSTFVYVWCNHVPDPQFLTFHVPKTIPPNHSLLSDRVSPNILILQVDALSYKRFPIVMPRTYRYIENLFKNPSPNLDVWKFDKFGIVGYNSAPAFLAMFGHTHAARHPDNVAWLWRQAKEHGYITALAETGCNGSKYGPNGINISSQECSQWFDYNWVLPYCGTGTFYQEDHPHCTRGKMNFKHVYDPLLQALEYYQTHKQPMFFISNLLEAHVENSSPARHMDDNEYASYLEQLIHWPNTITIFMSDHGLHYGNYYESSLSGKQEHRHPFMYITSTKKESIDIRNLDRLITPFDLWKTLTNIISGPKYIKPSNIEEIGFYDTNLDSSVDLFHSIVPSTRSCNQANMNQEPELCLCESPFAVVCPKPNSIVYYQWHTCTQIWAHPNMFDVIYYSKTYHITDLCEAIIHWCTVGVYQKLQSIQNKSIVFN